MPEDAARAGETADHDLPDHFLDDERGQDGQGRFQGMAGLGHGRSEPAAISDCQRWHLSRQGASDMDFGRWGRMVQYLSGDIE